MPQKTPPPPQPKTKEARSPLPESLPSEPSCPLASPLPCAVPPGGRRGAGGGASLGEGGVRGGDRASRSRGASDEPDGGGGASGG